MIGWYSYDPEHGYETFSTAKEAEDDASACLEHLRDKATDGWHEDTEAVQWGVLVPLAYAVKTEERPHDDPSFDYWCDFAIEAVSEPDNAALVELGRKAADALGELADARAELEGLRSLIAEAHRELSTIEAITVSPSDTDGLLDLVRRLKEAMPRNAEQKEARLRALGFKPVSEEQRAENLLVNLGVAK